MTTILVVDDEAPIRELLAWILKDLGYQVQEAINGREAIALAVAASAGPGDLGRDDAGDDRAGAVPLGESRSCSRRRR